MPLDPAFVADYPYGPDALFLDEILEVNRETGRVVARMPSHEELPLTRSQRVHPVKHPRHVNGGLMVHMTGMVGFVHAYYVLDLRHADGWIGYGGRIHSCRFKALAKPGEPMILECTAKQLRRTAKQILARYDLRFTQGDKVVYEGDQTAMWLLVEEGASLPSTPPGPSEQDQVV